MSLRIHLLSLYHCNFAFIPSSSSGSISNVETSVFYLIQEATWMEAKWLKLNLNLPVRSNLKWLWRGCIQNSFWAYLILSLTLSLSLCPFPPPGCFITADFNSQSGKVHLHREGLTSQVITKPSVRLINLAPIKNAGPARNSVSKEGTWGQGERRLRC